MNKLMTTRHLKDGELVKRWGYIKEKVKKVVGSIRNGYFKARSYAN